MDVQKVFSAGHGGSSQTANKYDPGAQKGVLDEAVIAKEIAKNLALDFAALGEHTGFRDTGLFYLADDEAVRVKAEEFYEVHLNAGGGTGVEVWVDEAATSFEKHTAATISAYAAKSLGLRNRGVKKNNWAVLKNHPNMESWLIEAFFIDSPNGLDYRRWSAAKDKYELAIVNAILAARGRRPATVLPRKTLRGKVRIRKFYHVI